MKIRKATEKDLNRIDEIYTEGTIDEKKLQFPRYSKKKILDELNSKKKSRISKTKKALKNKKEYWVVAEENKEIIGFGQAYLRNKDVGVTESAYVDKKHRRKGVGRKIMKELIKWIKNKKMKHIESNVLVKNTPSIKLQETFGFKPYLLRMRLR